MTRPQLDLAQSAVREVDQVKISLIAYLPPGRIQLLIDQNSRTLLGMQVLSLIHERRVSIATVDPREH